MFCLSKPGEQFVREYLRTQAGVPFSYSEVGATRGEAPRGYTLDHNRVCLGKGEAIYRKATDAIRQWRMFAIPWISLCYPDAPIEPDTVVAVFAYPFWPWSLNPARIIYVIDEQGAVDRYGFAYGTLPGHIEKGEERFSVEWNHADDSVWYDILAYSKPAHVLVRIGKPVARYFQRRFASESKLAILKAVTQ
jgi:uncharacterized protein (UPF0548 family)